MDSLSCELVGLQRDLPGVPAERWEVPISRQLTPTGKTQEVLASRLRASTRGLSRGVRRELGVDVACLVVVPVRAW